MFSAIWTGIFLVGDGLTKVVSINHSEESALCPNMLGNKSFTRGAGDVLMNDLAVWYSNYNDGRA
jgi:hypothetical protein